MDTAVREFGDILRGKGLPGALKFLNSRAPHRYTGVFRFDPPELRNVALADAWDSGAEVMSPAPLEETFCGFVRSTNAPFLTVDGPGDPRLSGHALASNAVQSYCGVMLLDTEGLPFGTLCHFDTRPCDVGVQAMEPLKAAADLIRDSRLLEND